MKAISTIPGLMAVVLLALAAGPVSAQAGLPEIEPYDVGTALPPISADDVVVRMTLQQAIDRALLANPNIQSVRLNPTLQAFAFRQAQIAFNPTFTANLAYNNSSNVST